MGFHGSHQGFVCGFPETRKEIRIDLTSSKKMVIDTLPWNRLNGRSPQEGAVHFSSLIHPASKTLTVSEKARHVQKSLKLQFLKGGKHLLHPNVYHSPSESVILKPNQGLQINRSVDIVISYIHVYIYIYTTTEKPTAIYARV